MRPPRPARHRRRLRTHEDAPTHPRHRRPARPHRPPSRPTHRPDLALDRHDHHRPRPALRAHRAVNPPHISASEDLEHRQTTLSRRPHTPTTRPTRHEDQQSPTKITVRPLRKIEANARCGAMLSDLAILPNGCRALSSVSSGVRPLVRVSGPRRHSLDGLARPSHPRTARHTVFGL